MRKNSIKDVIVPLQVVLGETRKRLELIATISEGTIIELDTLAGEPVSLLAAGELIAKGEVVVIDESFGIRVTSLVENGE